ncbi:MAG TPA: MFS transporter [Longimicrobiaceae bacterium]
MAQASAAQTVEHDKRLFWGCFIALVSTSFGFIARVLTAPEWGAQFNLTETQVGEILGAGLWPFAISIVLFSLVIDKIGYKAAMWFGLLCHTLSTVIILMAQDYSMMYLGTFVLALGSGTVEAYANPVVATVFSREKTRWLNYLHAGWPGGLVFGGILAIALGDLYWKYKIAIILIPTVIYALMLAAQRFPIHERVAAGVSYRDMLREVGALGALIASAMVIMQIGQIFGWSLGVNLALIAATTGVYAFYTRSLGRPLFILMLLVMIPLATTELGVDSWITTLMSGEMTRIGINAGWVLIYTSAIMMVLRFFAGSIVHRISPLGLLAVSATIAAIGLFALSNAAGAMILIAATLYGIGKSFFWPTSLGVVAEQFPRGGALTLNVVGGVGMLAVGVIGAPFMGLLQDRNMDENLAIEAPALHSQVMIQRNSIFGDYQAVNPELAATLPPADQEVIAQVQEQSQKDALQTIALLPVLMLIVYICLILYFRARGGYHPVAIEDAASREREVSVRQAATQA